MMKNIKKITLFALLTVVCIFAFKASFADATDDVITVKGVFTNITRPNVTLKSVDGTDYTIHLGPYWYWDDNNYSISLNSDAEIYGKLESGTKDIYAYKITQNDKAIKLVDDDNNPLWWNSNGGKHKGNRDGWGRGNGKGMGYCNGCCTNGWK